MKPNLLFSLLILTSLHLRAQEAEAPPVAEAPPAAEVAQADKKEIPGWGVVTDPDHDCKFLTTPGELLITVPGANGPHDLAAEVETTNAPRVLQAVGGDFVLQVKIGGKLEPGAESTLNGRTGYNGAGLVLVADAKNVVTLARAVLQREGEEPQPYANFEMRSNGELQRMGLTGDHPLPKDGAVYLRIERRGQKLSGAVSKDGLKWDVLEPMEIPSTWPLDLKVGVVAISTSKQDFSPHFTDLKILK